MGTRVLQDTRQGFQKAKGVVLSAGVGGDLLDLVAPKLARGCDLGPVSHATSKPVAPDQGTSFSQPQFPHLYNGDGNGRE